MQELLLVDHQDNVIGYGEKLSVHQKGELHRAFSIVVFNSKGELLLQKRAKDKYHSGGLWTNACCSHPLKDEELEDTLHKKLMGEMGFDCELHFLYKFIYRSVYENGLTEHEYDYVYVGSFDGKPNPDPEEAEDFKWMKVENIKLDILQHPETYSSWFKLIITELDQYSQQIHKLIF
ncbi:isopentenyl-diphosphate Delta-isomerase [Solitalea koreensis]|uniref:Isopentenyl-diphosphate delta-isomerase n=1 Tax=Solitalea koreensis TaxID=543615 RepID=A0A521CRE0_9SPHI|nr:isopentenyl-diphosphate Delta-isomerase [Solitalea koreensis]SMO62002.1 isopentenyl-diphosphate delta-isomerase [Solitalea koreensis]